MKVFVATIIADCGGPLANCREVDTDSIDEEVFSGEEEMAIRRLVGQGLVPGNTMLASSLAEGALGVGTTKEEAKKAALDEWCKQEVEMIDWVE